MYGGRVIDERKASEIRVDKVAANGASMIIHLVYLKANLPEGLMGEDWRRVSAFSSPTLLTVLTLKDRWIRNPRASKARKTSYPMDSWSDSFDSVSDPMLAEGAGLISMTPAGLKTSCGVMASLPDQTPQKRTKPTKISPTEALLSWSRNCLCSILTLSHC